MNSFRLAIYVYIYLIIWTTEVCLKTIKLF